MFELRGKDIPAKEWCSIMEALEWISFNIPPVPSSFNILPRSFYIRKDEPDMWSQKLREARSILFSYAINKFVTFRGKRALGNNVEIVHQHTDPYADNVNIKYIKIFCRGYGDYEVIPAEIIEICGKGRLTDDGILYYDKKDGGFAFVDLEVGFCQLIERQPPPNDMTLQIGAGELIPVLATPTDDGVTSDHTPPASQEPPPQGQSPAYLDPDHPYYSLKLAAAIAAWEALTANPALLTSKPPKSAAKKWLADNAKRLGLIKNDGAINGQGIEEVAKVINWRLTGGAPRTPGG